MNNKPTRREVFLGLGAAAFALNSPFSSSAQAGVAERPFMSNSGDYVFFEHEGAVYAFDAAALHTEMPSQHWDYFSIISAIKTELSRGQLHILPEPIKTRIQHDIPNISLYDNDGSFISDIKPENVSNTYINALDTKSAKVSITLNDGSEHVGWVMKEELAYNDNEILYPPTLETYDADQTSGAFANAKSNLSLAYQNKPISLLVTASVQGVLEYKTNPKFAALNPDNP